MGRLSKATGWNIKSGVSRHPQRSATIYGKT